MKSALLRRGTRVRHAVTDANGRVIRVSTSSFGVDYYVAVPHHSGGTTVSIWSAANTTRA